MDTIVVWFSCGVASAVAAKKTLEEFSKDHRVLIVNNPVVNEHPDNERFLTDCEEWFDQPIIRAKNPRYPTCNINEVFDYHQWMFLKGGAPCTMELKKKARHHFEKTNRVDFHVLGFTYDEEDRYNRFATFERANTLNVLGLLKITKEDTFNIFRFNGIKIPEIYSLGFPNANCIGCVKASSPTYWNLVRETFPDVFKERAEVSRKLGAKLVSVKRKRIFLDELDPNQKGGKIRNWECSIFCDSY
jgi:3'-phosphoadenosine 5'-phosphosulfate sulfotransferase (PAPS reductase)/FAD synthetase